MAAAACQVKSIEGGRCVPPLGFRKCWGEGERAPSARHAPSCGDISGVGGIVRVRRVRPREGALAAAMCASEQWEALARDAGGCPAALLSLASAGLPSTTLYSGGPRKWVPQAQL